MSTLSATTDDATAKLWQSDRRWHATPASESKSTPTSHVTPTVFVIDDDVSVRESLDLLIRCAGWQPETFESAQEFLARPRPLAPNCLVLDIAPAGLNGLDVQKRIAVARTDMPIICITDHADVPMTVQAMKAGAVDFLTKPFSAGVLLSAIQHAIERSQAALGHEAQMNALRACYASLSRREREVMALVVAGLLNKQVGSELGISEITVKAHRGSVMRKMKAASLPDLVNMAARLGVAASQDARQKRFAHREQTPLFSESLVDSRTRIKSDRVPNASSARPVCP